MPPLLSLVLLLLFVGQDPDRGGRSGGPAPHCEEGVVKDDGTAETGWGWVPSVVEGIYVQEYRTTELVGRVVTEVCLCWLRTSTDPDLDFEVVFYEEREGRPAAIPFAVVPALARDVPQGIGGRFYDVAIPAVAVPPGTFFVGARWNPNVDPFFFLCADTSPTTPVTNVFFIDDRADDWTSVLEASDPIFLVHRSVLVRLGSRQPEPLEIPASSVLALVVLALLLAALALLRL